MYNGTAKVILLCKQRPYVQAWESLRNSVKIKVNNASRIRKTNGVQYTPDSSIDLIKQNLNSKK